MKTGMGKTGALFAHPAAQNFPGRAMESYENINRFSLLLDRYSNILNAITTGSICLQTNKTA
jgi:hypothetical protein